MSAGRGPSGAAPFPPPAAELATLSLPIETLLAGTPLRRVHRSANDPIFFGPGVGVPPTYRFDSAAGAFGVLYFALDFAGALAETLLRNPRRKMVGEADIAARSVSILGCRRDLRLVRLHGKGLQRLGLDNAISTGPYPPCGAWADALFSHPQTPDGLVFRSRHDPDRRLAAIFERPGLALDAAPPAPLRDRLGEVAAILRSYGKSVAMRI